MRVSNPQSDGQSATNQNTLDIREILRGFHRFTRNEQPILKTQRNYSLEDAVTAIEAWHQQQTTKDMLALLPEKLPRVVKARPGQYYTFQPQVEKHRRKGFNDAIEEIRKSVQAREDNQE